MSEMSDMTIATKADLEEMFGEPVETFEPFAYYNHEGDCVEFFAKSEKYYGQWIDHYVTVYRSSETDEIIGSLITNVRYLCKKLSAQKSPVIEIVIEDDQICIQHLFFVQWIANNHADTAPVYQKLTELAVNSDINSVKLSC